jgi:hypothetical protein
MLRISGVLATMVTVCLMSPATVWNDDRFIFAEFSEGFW